MNKIKALFKRVTRKLNKRVMKWVGIACLLFLFIIPMRYVNTLTGYTGLVFFVSVILISAILMLMLKKKISVESSMEFAKCVRGDMREVGLVVRNESRIISPRAVTTFFMKDMLGEVVVEKELVFAIGAKARNVFNLRAPMKHIGEYRIGLSRLLLNDMSGLFQMKVNIEGDYGVVVLPRIRDIYELTEEIEADNVESDNSITIPGGLDYMGVREYEQGDSMKMIHWKLSARSSDYMTKLTETNMRNSYVVMIEFDAPAYDREILLDINDCLIETSLSIVTFLSREDVIYSFMYADKSRTIRRETPDEDQIERIAGELDKVSTGDPKAVTAESIIMEESNMGLQSSNLIMCTSNIQGSTVQALIEVKRQRRAVELFFIIPEELNSREREKAMAPLGALDEAGVVYHVISTKVNETGKEKNEKLS